MNAVVEVKPTTTFNSTLGVQIVDHDIQNGTQVLQMMQNLGYNCEYFTNTKEILATPPAAHWGCVLLDVRLAYYNGNEVVSLLRKHDSKLPIIFMGTENDIHMAIKVFKAGAFDFIIKPLQEQNVLEVINHALHVREKMMDEKQFLVKVQKNIHHLSNRESQVLAKLLEGMSNKNIAAFLEISAKTVEQHRASIMKKMQANSFAELVSTVVKYNMINHPSAALSN